MATAHDVADLHRRAVESFQDRVHDVQPDQWDGHTPCSDWTVRDLVGHVTSENLWTVPLLAGRTIEQVGTALDGDVLGDQPVRAFDDAASAARRAVEDLDSLDEVVHLSMGDTAAREYLWQLFADHVVHGWDLAVAIGGDARLDDELVEACGQWFTTMEADYRQAGAVGPVLTVPGNADSQTRLLAAFGRGNTLWAVARFNEAFNSRDVAAVMERMTDDCVFESTGPAPDGQRHEGRQAVHAVWEEFFASSPSARFTTEESVVAGDRATVRWRYDWDGGHVRGVDVLRLRDGLVAEKLSYVKG